MDSTQDSGLPGSTGLLDGDSASSTPDNNSGTPVTDDRVPTASDATGSTLSPGQLTRLKMKAYDAMASHRHDDVRAMLSGLHPADIREVLQGSRPFPPKGVSLLTIAVARGYINHARTLLEMGADVNYRYGTLLTPLETACQHKDMAMVSFLVEEGARTDVANAEGRSCLMEATRTDAVDIVSYLLDNGTDPNQETCNGTTPLHEAAERGYLEMTKLLVARGAKVNHANKDGSTPLHIACQRNHSLIARHLAENGATACASDNHGYTCLMQACMNDNVDVAKIVLENGADLNQATHLRGTALHVSVHYGCLKVARLLVSKGADVNIPDIMQQTALFIACQWNHEEIARHLLNNGARTDIEDEEGNNCLIVACRSECVEVAHLLLERGMDPNYKSSSGKTPLGEAATKDSREMAELLLKHGATLCAGSDGHTPLVGAICRGNFDFMDCILASSAISRVQRAEALELLAARTVLSSSDTAYMHLRRAMAERYSDPSDVLLKPHHPPVAALGSVVESQTLQELESRRQDQVTLMWECCLAVERILGANDPFAVKFYRETYYRLQSQRRFGEALALWAYMVKVLHTEESDSMSLLFEPETLVFSRSPTLEEMTSVLETAVALVEAGTVTLTTFASFQYIQLALLVARGQAEMDQLQRLLLRLMAAQSTDPHGSTLLHFAVSVWEYSLPLDRHASLITLLLQSGADVNAADSLGNTPLHLLVQWQDKDQAEIVCHITKILLESGPHLNLRNNRNQTALDCTAMPEVRAVLQEWYPLPLQCLAAAAVAQSGIPYQDLVPQKVQDFITMHKPGQQ